MRFTTGVLAASDVADALASLPADLAPPGRCYCNGNTDGMSKAAEEASQRITQLQAKLEEDKATKSGRALALAGTVQVSRHRKHANLGCSIFDAHSFSDCELLIYT